MIFKKNQLLIKYSGDYVFEFELIPMSYHHRQVARFDVYLLFLLSISSAFGLPRFCLTSKQGYAPSFF
jgi:hypothetical protein